MANIKVTVINPSTPVPSKTNALDYGIKTIKGATDLVLNGAADGSVIYFDKANNDFILQIPSSNNIQVTSVDGGNY